MDINQKIVNACQRLASTDDAIMYYVQTKATPEERVNALKNLSWNIVENYIYNVIDMNDLVEAIFSNFDDGKSYTIEEISDIINKNKSTRLIRRITTKRNNQAKDYVRKTARYIVNYCINNNIGTIICGYNSDFKRSINLGKMTNQQFTQISFGSLREQLSSLCEQYGMRDM